MVVAGKIKWTREQLDAVRVRVVTCTTREQENGGLVERIIQRIMDPRTRWT